MIPDPGAEWVGKRRVHHQTDFGLVPRSVELLLCDLWDAVCSCRDLRTQLKKESNASPYYSAVLRIKGNTTYGSLDKAPGVQGNGPDADANSTSVSWFAATVLEAKPLTSSPEFF